MAATKQLELNEDITFQEREWRLQRAGWAVWGLVLLAGLLGILGPGPLSKADSSTSDGSLTVGYERFLHYHHPTQLEITLHADGLNGQPARIKISQPLLDRIQVLRIEPEPERRELSDDGIIYTFPTADATERGKILFHVEYEKPGRTRGRIGLVDQQSATFTQFVYP